MPLSRREFCGIVGATALAARTGSPRVFPAADPLRLDSNENPYGPFPSALRAMERALREAHRYPSTAGLIAAIAHANRVAEANVLLTVGATEGLYLAAKAFTGTEAPLVTAAPSYAAIATATEQLGHPVIRVPILPEGGLDLPAMVDRSRGAGVLYICNPNNPTGVITPAAELRSVIARTGEISPETVVVIGEVYHEYIDASSYSSLALDAIQNPRILVNRTFSKLYGLAGLRLGYLIGQEETLRKVAAHRVPLGANVIAMAGAIASLEDPAELARQRRLTREGRDRAARFFQDQGYRFYQPSANYVFVDVKRDITAFRAQCQEKGLLIGRPYPPANTWMRLTVGTPEEMRAAFEILEPLL